MLYFSNALKKIEVNVSWKEALEFVGYDFDRWLEGKALNSLITVFWIISTINVS